MSTTTGRPASPTRQLLDVRGPVAVPAACPWIAWARAWTQWSTWSGRASRSEFWWTWSLQVVLAAVCLVLVPWALGRGDELRLQIGPFGPTFLPDLTIFSVATGGRGDGASAVTIAWALWCVATFAGMVTLTVRRLHDANFSAGWGIASVVLPVLQLPVLVMLARRTQEAGVRFDASARDPEGEAPAGA